MKKLYSLTQLRVFRAQQIPFLLKELEAGSILWDTIDKMMKKNDGEPDDDYATCEKMVHS